MEKACFGMKKLVAGWPASRFRDSNRWFARLVLALICGLTAITAMPHDAARYQVITSVKGGYSDQQLYRDITSSVQAGRDYYSAAAALQRTHGYPTAPAVVFREPFEALLLASLRTDGLRWGLLLGLGAAAFLLLRKALDQLDLSLGTRLLVMVMAATGFANLATPSAPYVHEIWGGMLLTLSLAAYRRDAWIASVALGFCACLFREIAAPYLLVMFLAAAVERNWRECAAWFIAAALFVAVMAVHLVLASRQHLPGDGISPGWLRFGGWPFVITMALRNLLFTHLPLWGVSLGVSLCFLGMAGVHHPWMARVAATVMTFALIFAVAGRQATYYWGILYAPLLPLGLAFAPPALFDLVRAALGRPGPAELGPVVTNAPSPEIG
ncbi:hypothetical protein [Phenylobacterium montanum]|uniref:Uncharacterized protein n=1 Tax=Phenylobacterium montanum TaxID=2823693 RepID=A0A975IV29_9CAUL|nr:hypothetical protein [Caulobacter sp. S6]QUD88139.1 hypothetical protein KCG34_24440 [Caulobacter sp. S6]